MAKGGYKLQEFVAHTTNVNCLSMGKKTCRLFITGGDDHKVNVWAIGKPTSLMSLCGHTSPVESLAFDSTEVLVLAGAATGVIKLWDLEETKMVRGFTGHKSNCTAMEFHPFGEFFASGSLDTNLKIWDIRKKGCIHTYKGHTRGISTIRFTPDGRWVVSGGFDNVVKVWDLTAGKLLHDFEFHEGHIRSLEFHPLEFLLATGSADRTVKFWDLETFELIGSSRPEATGVRAITFHPDGRTLFCGSDDSLQVYSWEPVVCHDSFEMGWSTLGDLCISEGKLLGCSYYRNSVGVWVTDVAHIQPYDRKDCMEKKFNLEGSYSLEKAGSGMRSALGSRPLSTDYETNEIKNIYVDTAGSNPIASQKAGSLNSPKVVFPLDASEISNLAAEKQSPEAGVIAKSDGQIGNKYITTPSIITRDNPVEKDSTKSEKESITFSRTKPGMLLRPAHVRRPSVNKFELEKSSTTVESGTLCNSKVGLDSAMDLNAQTKLVLEDGLKKSCDENSDIKSVTEKSEKMVSLQTPLIKETCNEFISCNKDSNSVKFVNGVAVVPGRTRTLVEKFERREKLNCSNDLETNNIPPLVPDTDSTPVILKEETQISKTQSVSVDENSSESRNSRAESPSGCEESNAGSQISSRESTPTSDGIINGDQISQMKLEVAPDRIVTGNQSSKKESTLTPDRISTGNQISRREPSPASSGIIAGNRVSRRGSTFASDRISNRNLFSRREPSPASNGIIAGNHFSRRGSTFASDRISNGNQFSRRESTSSFDRIITRSQVSRRKSSSTSHRINTGNQVSRRESTSGSDSITTGSQISVKESPPISDGIITRSLSSRREAISANEWNIPNGTISENQTPMRGLNSANEGNITVTKSQISEGEPTCANDVKIAESLMQTHDIFLSTLRSRLTKLQVVWHFWEKNDIKGAIGALRKLPDHSVQVDVISVLMEKMEILTLDLFSGLLPVLMGLLDSKMERHVNVSLEMLLKLVAVFGPMIRSTVSAPRGVGVDLHAEQRRECCNQCFMQLQKIQKLLPLLVRGGGAIARCAEELSLALQE